MSVVGYILSRGIKTFLVPIYRACGICREKSLCRWFDVEMRIPMCQPCALEDMKMDAMLNTEPGYRRPDIDTPTDR